MLAAVRFMTERLALVWSQKYLTVASKPDRSGMPILHRQKRERDRSLPKERTAHFQKAAVIS